MKEDQVLIYLYCYIYNQGYKAGHRDTVEGDYTDIHHYDMATYHKEEVKLIAEEFENSR